MASERKLEANRANGLKGSEATKMKFALIEQKYNENPKKCKQCLSPIPYASRCNTFCCRTCGAIHSNLNFPRTRGPKRIAPVKANCKHCGVEIDGRRKFCSVGCSSGARLLSADERKRRRLASGRAGSSKHRNKYGDRNVLQNLTNEERILVMSFYAECPEGYEVDHIVPLSKGGAHALTNLQHIKKEENRSKSNRIDVNHVDGTCSLYRVYLNGVPDRT